MSCGKGFIVRKGYLRKGFFRSDGTYVEPSYVDDSCIIDQGLPGKGVKIVANLEDMLHPFGYKLALSDLERKKILIDAYDSLDHLSMLKYLVYLRTLNKSREKNYNKLDKDVKFIQEMYDSDKLQKEIRRIKKSPKRSPRRSPRKSVKRSPRRR